MGEIKKLRFKNIKKFKISFGWFGLQKERFYYDGWHNILSIFFISFSWITPPLEGDLDG